MFVTSDPNPLIVVEEAPNGDEGVEHCLDVADPSPIDSDYEKVSLEACSRAASDVEGPRDDECEEACSEVRRGAARPTVLSVVKDNFSSGQNDRCRFWDAVFCEQCNFGVEVQTPAGIEMFANCLCETKDGDRRPKVEMIQPVKRPTNKSV